MILGIDIGLDGAIAALSRGNLVGTIDLPTMAAPYVTRANARQINCAALHDVIVAKSHEWDDRIECACLELLSAMPKQGVSSMFSLGASFGAVLGVLGGLKIPVQLVRPQVWKKHYGLIGASKDHSRALAIQKFPMFEMELRRKRDHNRAEAILIGLYASQSQGGTR